MSAGGWMMSLIVAATVGTLILLIVSLVRGIHDQRTEGRSVWREFGLGLILMILFFVTWLGHAVTEWQVFTDQQRQQGSPVRVGDFMAEFMQSTLENWQSEFLQLFSFVVLAALYIHKSSAESKDGEEKLEASLRRIEAHLGTLPATAPTEPGESWCLPETPLEVMDQIEARRRR